MTTTLKERQRAHAHKVGLEWAAFFNLKKSTTNPECYLLPCGERTAMGVYSALKRLVREDGKPPLFY